MQDLKPSYIKTFANDDLELSTEDLSVLYGGKVQKLFDASLQFKKNTITALIGASGSGKSTFLRSLNRMNDRVATVNGKIWFHGLDVNKSNINVYELRKNIGMVFQRPNPFPKSIRENIVYALKADGHKDRAELDRVVEESLRAAALWDEVKDKLDKSALALSGGQQQRLCIARALAIKPEILLLDEPASALDPVSTSKLEDTLKQLRSKYTMIMVTHNMQQASRISDYTAFFHLGHAIEYNSTAEIFTNPKDVHLSYGNYEALHGISLDFKKKELTALIGPSGCGKSTFLRCLNRMNDDIENIKITGEIKFEGQDIYNSKMDLVSLRKEVGMVFQQPTPFPFSVYDNVAYGLKIAGVKDKELIDQRVEESLKQAAIWKETKDNLTRNAQAFSGGQQQRICIARALAVRPKVVLLDEPTSALDPISSSEIEETLMELKHQYTFIMVTHNLQQAGRISDQTAFLMNGDLIEAGPTEEMFIAPKKQITSDYLNGRFG